MEKMKAAIFKGNGVLKVEEVPVPKTERDDQILIKVRAASICGSDLHALHVPPGQVYDKDIVMGHEYFGEIIGKGAGVTNFEIGENIAVNPCMPCGECWECNRFNFHHLITL